MKIFVKTVCLIVLILPAYCLFSEENQDNDDEVLTVRTQFPRYRVLYDHQKTLQEVQDQLEKEKSGEENKTVESEK